MNNCYKISNKLSPEAFNQNVKPVFNLSTVITVQHVEGLIRELQNVICFWKANDDYLIGALVQFNFCSLLSKSKRISHLFSNNSGKMVGAHFIKETSEEKEIIKHAMVYHFQDLSSLNEIAKKLSETKNYIQRKFGGFIDKENSEKIVLGDLLNCGRDWIISFLLEIERIEHILVPAANIEAKEQMMVHFYLNPEPLFKKLGIHVLPGSKYGERTVLLTKSDFQKILDDKASFFVASDYVDYFNEPLPNKDELIDIDPPLLGEAKDEPFVGVIDTAFDTGCYLYKKGWVEYLDLRDSYLADNSLECKAHGTAVTSLIVHGDEINAELGLLDDCGHFRVKHFAIANLKYNSTLSIMRQIEDVVKNNYKEIKVWNLSLGSEVEVNQSFISPVAALLDEIQEKYDVLFIIAGTNKPQKTAFQEKYRIGSPADSINGLVVNSVRQQTEEPVSYSRCGPVLDFFIKPDVSYYGGDKGQEIRYFNGSRMAKGSGTSYAAPLVARKAAYLIYKAGLSKEAAKAFLIDSASRWNDYYDTSKKGRGVVPITIGEVLNCKDDEVRFVFIGTINDYSSFDYSLPMPLNPKNKKSPFIGRAVMCYTTDCSPDNGVDYTNVEVDLKFGPVVNGKLKSIKPDKQHEPGYYINEEQARKAFLKWDNVKRIKEPTKKGYRERDVKESGKWGFKFITTYRNVNKPKEEKYNFKFAVVVTLKSIDGKNRSLEFLKLVQASTWTIEVINIHQIDLFNNIIEQDAVFED